jgi:hypothetical protein
LTFDLAGTAGGEIRWITSLDERRLWEQFVGLVKEAGQTRTTR